MSRFPTLLTVVLIGLFSLMSYVSVQAQDATTTTTVEHRVIVTPVPPPKEEIATPTGYVSCDTVAGTWNGAVWVPEHQVCRYSNSTEGVAWVASYWGCTEYSADTGECTKWEWTPGHWVKTYTTY